MKIEIGKRYIPHNEEPTEYIEIIRYDSSKEKYIGITHYESGMVGEEHYYNKEGQFVAKEPNFDLISEYKEVNLLDTLHPPLTVAEAERLYPTSCNHNYINVGFSSIKMVCNKCNKEEVT